MADRAVSASMCPDEELDVDSVHGILRDFQQDLRSTQRDRVKL